MREKMIKEIIKVTKKAWAPLSTEDKVELKHLENWMSALSDKDLKIQHISYTKQQGEKND